jgi:hypothetical protein
VTGLEAGLIYRFTYIALNAYGESEPSSILTIGVTDLPDVPSDIVVDWDRSDKDYMMIQWSAPANDPALLITGYTLEMDNGHGGRFV